jgi:hypothetical protein
VIGFRCFRKNLNFSPIQAVLDVLLAVHVGMRLVSLSFFIPLRACVNKKKQKKLSQGFDALNLKNNSMWGIEFCSFCICSFWFDSHFRFGFNLCSTFALEMQCQLRIQQLRGTANRCPAFMQTVLSVLFLSASEEFVNVG